MIDIQHHPSQFLFEAFLNDEKVGVMTYSYTENNEKISINHTVVAPEFNGRGIGKKLVLAGIDFARKERKKIIPRCSFVKVVLESKEEYQDVI